MSTLQGTKVYGSVFDCPSKLKYIRGACAVGTLLALVFAIGGFVLPVKIGNIVMLSSAATFFVILVIAVRPVFGLKYPEIKAIDESSSHNNILGSLDKQVNQHGCLVPNIRKLSNSIDINRMINDVNESNEYNNKKKTEIKKEDENNTFSFNKHRSSSSSLNAAN